MHENKGRLEKMKINIPQDVFIEAVKSSGGVITLIQERLKKAGYKLSRKKVYEKIAERATIIDLLEEEREKTKDAAELNLINAIQQGDLKISIEYLKRKAKDRGYGDEIGVAGVDGKDLKIQVKIIKGEK